ncbi:MAG: S-formylglutathione hydrolase [Myxococcales bacterium]|nr:S-formylglutathione hydrolase [Myxococcales bacterium]
MMGAIQTKSSNRCFGGTQGVYQHHSKATGTPMTFSLYLPPGAEPGRTPALFYLSGLTCTWENATTKAGAQRSAAEHGLALVFPDTSPRGDGVADADDWQLGQGAGFYLDATEDPWKPHFQMESYIAELHDLAIAHFDLDPDRVGIMGHSMGGHGALTLAMKHPHRYRSLSALSAITAPSRVEWGQKALRAYLGDDREAWARHDACALMASRGWHGDILLDQGLADGFIDGLRPEWLADAAKDAGVSLTLRQHEGYDHSYYFVSTFIADHLAWHAKRLGAK